MTLSLDLTDPQRLELFPLIFAYNHISTEVVRALRVGDMKNVMSLQTPLNELRWELERRGILGRFIELKRRENQELLERAEHAQQTPVGQGEHTLN